MTSYLAMRSARKVLVGACIAATAALAAPSLASGAHGDLTYSGCISGETESTPCTLIASAVEGGEYSGLDYLLSVAVSPDGSSVYVASRYDSAVARFDRDPSTGELTYEDCTTGNTETGEDSGACSEIGSAVDEGTNSGLNGPRAVTVGPAGRWLYVAVGNDDAVARFERDPATGVLTYADCITGRTEAGPTPGVGSGACTAIPTATPGGGGSGLNNLQALAVSADGSSLYAAAFGDDAIAHFDRDPATGVLTYVACISGSTETVATCVQTPSAATDGEDSGLDRPHSLALSPDGSSVYVASQRDASVASLIRDPTDGTLAYSECTSGETESAGCTQIPHASPGGVNSGLNTPFSVKVGPEGSSLYVAARDDDAVARFERDPANGALTYADCITGSTEVGPDPDGSGACTATPTAAAEGDRSGLNSLRSLALTADGKSLYGASRGDDAVSHFERDPATGALSYRDCLTGAADRLGAGGADACNETSSATSNGEYSGLDSLFELAISPDDKSLYSAARYDDAIATFTRELVADPADPPDPPVDTTPPGLELSGSKTQRSAKQVKVKATSDEAAAVVATGTIKVPKVNGARGSATVAGKRYKLTLKPASTELTAGETRTLKLRLGKQARKKLKRALGAGKTSRAKIAVTATDAAGNESSAKFQVKVKKKS